MRVLVVTSGWPTPDHPSHSIFVARQVDDLRALGVEVDVLSYLGGGDPRSYLRARRRFAEMTRAAAYDLIHAHFGQSFLVAAGAGVRRAVPLVMTFHGSDLFGVAGRFGYSPRTPLLRAISRRAARTADAVIVPSRRLAARLPAGVRPKVIPIGIDMDVFRPRPRDEARGALGLGGEERLVLFGGSPRQPVKRIGLARAVVDALPAPGARLVTIEDRPQDEVALWMAACDALLLTSRHESGPTMVKEALACDLPVVSLDVGDVAEWVGDLDGASVCPSEDPGVLAAHLDRVLEGSGTFRSDGRGRDAVRSLERSAVAATVLRAYHEVAGDTT